MSGKFNLAELISDGKVSKLDTGAADDREQIEYIDIDLIDDDPNNFYSLSGLDQLAANIELMGLQQPLRVRANPENADRVIIVSGHRRRAAIRLLVEDGRTDLREIPCIRERLGGSAALQELRLIYANSNTRDLTSAEISKQAERVEALLYQLKEEGYEFPGRMRDHVAEACKVSKTKLARLKVIREKLDKVWKPSYEKGTLTESVAYELARMPPKHQMAIFNGQRTQKNNIKWFYEYEAKRYGEILSAIDKLTCKKDGGAPCSFIPEKYDVVCTKPSYSAYYCDKCCDKCADLSKCKNACPKLAEKVKKLRADAKEQRRQERIAQEEKNRPVISEIMKYWQRFGEARNAADKTVEACYRAMGRYYRKDEDQKVVELECLEAEFTTSTCLPYSSCCYLSDIQGYVHIADLLGCSLDYLLCRTDNPRGFAAPAAEPPAEGWIPLKWIPGQEHPKKDKQLAVALFVTEGMDHPMRSIVEWDSFIHVWRFAKGGAALESKCVGWFPLPEWSNRDD